jgi:transposase-like protein
MKDSHMIFVLLAVLITPFLPFILKGKCPQCGKRKLESIESPESIGKTSSPFIAYFTCNACRTNFMREKSGPLTPMSDDQIADYAQV